MQDQLEFSFMKRDEYDINNYIINGDNEHIYNYLSGKIEDLFEHNIIFLIGPEKCGKTHLANIFKATYNAKFIDYDKIRSETLEEINSYLLSVIEIYDYYIIENLRKDFDEEKLFHILNIIIENNSKILITSNYDIRKRKIKLKDLNSRIKSSLFFEIKPKISKDIKSLLIIKLFADKQIKIDSKVLVYLTKKLDNKYIKIYNFIEKLNNIGLEEKKNLTIPLIKKYI